MKDGDLTRPFAVEEKNIQRYREAAAEISKIFNEPFEGTDKELIEAVDRMAKLFDDYLGGKIKPGEFQDAIGVDLSNKKDVALLDELAESLHRNGFLKKEDKDNDASSNVSEIKHGEDVLDYATRLADEQANKDVLEENLMRPSFLGEPYSKKHDKTGADIHIAPIKERVSTEVFNDMKQMAKESGGSYSNFISGKKSRTDVGFVFKTQEGLNKFLKKVSEAYLSENANDTRVDSSNDIELKSDEKLDRKSVV